MKRLLGGWLRRGWGALAAAGGETKNEQGFLIYSAISAENSWYSSIEAFKYLFFHIWGGDAAFKPELDLLIGLIHFQTVIHSKSQVENE